MRFTQEILWELLDYRPGTGEFLWRERGVQWFGHRKNPDRCRDRWNVRNAGRPALDTPVANGHLVGRIVGIPTKAHVAAWIWCYDLYPTFAIDHIDGNPANNAIKNLRDVPQSANARNKRMQSNNTSGENGVYREKRSGRWLVRVGGHAFGCYREKEAAIEARDHAYRLLGGFTLRHGKVDYSGENGFHGGKAVFDDSVLSDDLAVKSEYAFGDRIAS